LQVAAFSLRYGTIPNRPVKVRLAGAGIAKHRMNWLAKETRVGHHRSSHKAKIAWQ
jgi:hypothetical protein